MGKSRREYFRRYRAANRDKIRDAARVAARRRYAADPEKACERVRRDYATNRERRRASARQRYAADPEKGRERNRSYREANRDKLRLAGRRRRAANPAKVAQQYRRWREANLELVRANQRQRRAALHAADPAGQRLAHRLWYAARKNRITPAEWDRIGRVVTATKKPTSKKGKSK